MEKYIRFRKSQLEISGNRDHAETVSTLVRAALLAARVALPAFQQQCESNRCPELALWAADNWLLFPCKERAEAARNPANAAYSVALAARGPARHAALAASMAAQATEATARVKKGSLLLIHKFASKAVQFAIRATSQAQVEEAIQEALAT